MDPLQSGTTCDQQLSYSRLFAQIVSLSLILMKKNRSLGRLLTTSISLRSPLLPSKCSSLSQSIVSRLACGLGMLRDARRKSRQSFEAFDRRRKCSSVTPPSSEKRDFRLGGVAWSCWARSGRNVAIARRWQRICGAKGVAAMALRAREAMPGSEKQWTKVEQGAYVWSGKKNGAREVEKKFTREPRRLLF